MALFARRRRERSAVSLVVKYTIFFFTLICMLLGLALTIVTIYVLVIKKKKVRTAIDFLFDPSCLFCFGGLLCLFVAFFGCAGSLRENVIFLKIYHWSLSFFLFVETIVIILIFVFYYVPNSMKAINVYPEDFLKDAIVKYRDDEDMKNFIDGMQETLDCCGISNDDKGYLDWNQNKYFNCTNPDSFLVSEECAVPYSCCMINPGDRINYLCGGGALKTTEPTALTNIHTQGCLKGLRVQIDKNAFVIGGIILAAIIFQFFIIFLAKKLESQIEEQMSKWQYQ